MSPCSCPETPSSFRTQSSRASRSACSRTPSRSWSAAAMTQVKTMSADARPAPDQALVDMAEYVDTFEVTRAEACRMARYCLMDALGCAVEALRYPECTKLLGPLLPGTVYPHGVKVPGTRYELDPVSGAFNIGAMIRWL